MLLVQGQAGILLGREPKKVPPQELTQCLAYHFLVTALLSCMHLQNAAASGSSISESVQQTGHFAHYAGLRAGW